MAIDGPDPHGQPSSPPIPLHDLSQRQIQNVGSDTGSDAMQRSHDAASVSPSRQGHTVPIRPVDDSLGDTSTLSGTNCAMESTPQRVGNGGQDISLHTVNSSNGQNVAHRKIRQPDSLGGQNDETSGPLDSLLLDGVPSKGQTKIQVQKRDAWVVQSRAKNHPLKGKSFRIFPPDSPIRLKLCDVLVHPLTEPMITGLIVLQLALLIVNVSVPDTADERSRGKLGRSWVNWAIFALFCIFTAELIAKSIVAGFIITPRSRRTSGSHVTLGAFTTGLDDEVQVRGGSKAQRRAGFTQRAFLQHTLSCIDLIAVCAFWAGFTLNLRASGDLRRYAAFRMLSSLRILRLIHLTPRGKVMLYGLKRAIPMLLKVALLIGFLWLLFSIIGVQSFKSSLRRNCVWFDPDDLTGRTNWTNKFQFCGGWLAENGSKMPWLLSDGERWGAHSHRGFICPMQSKCIEGQNPYNGSVSFDNIFHSLELVLVVLSGSEFSDLMYYLTNSDHLAAALFFACCVLVLSFWLRSLVIAAITSSFQFDREEFKSSTFTNADNDTDVLYPIPRRKSALQRIRVKINWFWILIIIFGLISQSCRTAAMSGTRRKFIDTAETVVTFVLLFEIVTRFLTDWRNFFRSKRNNMDLVLAIITSIIQIPAIRHSGQPYAWLTLFQILRIYRVIWAFPVTRTVTLVVVGSVSGFFNFIIFVFMLVFLAAVLASQMFHGLLPSHDVQARTITNTFNSIWNSFLGMYQVFSSQNWNTIVYNLTAYNVYGNTAWIGAIFFILWFIFANFVLMNMFIAVMQENFDISDDEKRLQQVKVFLEQTERSQSKSGNLAVSTIVKYSVGGSRENRPSGLEKSMRDMLVKKFLNEENSSSILPYLQDETEISELRAAPAPVTARIGTRSKLANLLQKLTDNPMGGDPNPFYSKPEKSVAPLSQEPRQIARKYVDESARAQKAKREYLQRHPTYNVSLFIFKPHSHIRRACQRIVGPGRGGRRVEGVEPSLPLWYAFSAFIYLAIIAMVVLACITTPLYQKNYFRTHHFSVTSWFVCTDIGFTALFTIEALIKIIADGFFFTPHAIFRSWWGITDGAVLVTLWINIIASLSNKGQISRAISAFKAFRAIRLLNVSDGALEVFHGVIIEGGFRLISFALVSISLLIPFAIYGLNLFVGKLQFCNDFNLTAQSGYRASIYDLNDCVGEYMTNSTPSNWNILAPRVVSNPYFSFDSFGDSLFILFQIASHQGWADVMWKAIGITSVGHQPSLFSSYGNAVFFIIFNILSIGFIVTLFTTVFMRNFVEQTKMAFLTVDQTGWLELRKFLLNVRPVQQRVPGRWKQWFFRRAARKRGRWSTFVTCILVFHLILLCTQFYPDKKWWDLARNVIFLLSICVYIADIAFRIVGFGFSRYRKGAWNLYSLVTVTSAFVTTALAFFREDDWVVTQVQWISLVLVALLLIPRIDQLDELFKTIIEPLPLILNLMAVWFVLYVIFAIALTQTLGLAKFNKNEDTNINFRDVPRAFILLFRTSMGQGWNQIMEDFATMKPPYCSIGNGYLDGDCGSKEWARFLFIIWNILSMYIFANLFISFVYEAFSAFVYQRNSGRYVVSREDIRRFKQAWAVFDPMGTGFLSVDVFPRLLGELSGAFEMRTYDGDFAVHNLITDCSKSPGLFMSGGMYRPLEIDLKKLNERLGDLPVEVIQKRRRRMAIFFEEVLASSDPDRGIAFTTVLMLLAHHNIIDGSKSLRIAEFLRRRIRLERIEETVTRKTISGFLDTIYWNRKFRAHLSSKGMTVASKDNPKFEMPPIFTEDLDSS